MGGLAVAGSDDYLSLALAQAILSGLMFVLMSIFKLGFLANFLSRPILEGFVGGLALEILVSQVAKMLGISLDAEGFLAKVIVLAQSLGTLQPWSLSISVVSLAVL